MYGYSRLIDCGWKTGVHDCRFYRYQHPWVVVHRESGFTVGRYSREEARRILRDLRRGVPPEYIERL